MVEYIYRTALGQDSHRYGTGEEPGGPLLLAGYEVPDGPWIAANSDGDVLYHAVTNALSGLTGHNILGRAADELCSQGVRDSEAYLKLALSYLGALELVHVSCSIEAKRPKLEAHIPAIRARLAAALGLELRAVGLTATTGEGLTGMGRGEGMAALCVLTAREPLLT